MLQRMWCYVVQGHLLSQVTYSGHLLSTRYQPPDMENTGVGRQEVPYIGAVSYIGYLPWRHLLQSVPSAPFVTAKRCKDRYTRNVKPTSQLPVQCGVRSVIIQVTNSLCCAIVVCDRHSLLYREFPGHDTVRLFVCLLHLSLNKCHGRRH